jgi:hypothetical protein
MMMFVMAGMTAVMAVSLMLMAAVSVRTKHWDREVDRMDLWASVVAGAALMIVVGGTGALAGLAAYSVAVAMGGGR